MGKPSASLQISVELVYVPYAPAGCLLWQYIACVNHVTFTCNPFPLLRTMGDNMAEAEEFDGCREYTDMETSVSNSRVGAGVSMETFTTSEELKGRVGSCVGMETAEG